MKINYYYATTIVLILLGVFLRFYNIEQFGTFGHDNSRDVILTYKMFKYHEWQYRGPVFSLVWAHLSPIYYYLIAPFYFVMGFHPLAPAITSSVLNIIALILIFWTSKEIFGRTTSIFATIIYSVSFLVIKEGAFGLNPCFMPMFALIFIYGVFLKIKKANWIGSILISFSLAMLVSFHPSGFFVIPVLVVLAAILRPKFSVKELAYSGLILFVAAALPYAYQEKKFNGWDIIKIQEYLNTPKTEAISFIDYMNNFFKIYSLNTSTTLFYSSAPFYVFLSILLILAVFYFAIQTYQKRDFINILAFIIALYSIVFGFVMKFTDVGLHEAWFQSVLIPWMVIFIAALLAKIKRKETYFPILILFLIIVTQNLYNYFNYTSEEDKFYTQKLIYENIRRDSAGADFDILGEDSQPFLYMLWYYEPESELKDRYFSWIKWAKSSDSKLVYYLDTSQPVDETLMKELYRIKGSTKATKIFTVNGRNLYRID